MNPFDVYAQTDSVGPTVYRIIFALIGLIVLLLFFLIYRRVKGRLGGSDVRPSAGLDLITLKKKGLLTPEELERVGQSMLRQMKQKEEAEQRKRGIKSADALMLDPEVRRLEVLAAARDKAEKTAARSSQAEISSQAGVSPTTPLAGTTQSAGAPASTISQSDTAEPTDEELEKVELPLDVQQLVDSGLLNADEVRNVKRRLLERRRQQ